MSKITGKLVPIRDRVFFTDMNFDEEVTASGLVLQSDNGKGAGVKPRWGRVYAVGPDQHDVKVGEWILIEHGRWTRTFELENNDGSITKLQVADNKGIMLSCDEKPADSVQRGVAAGAGSNFNFNIPGA
jgi:co-chaperonin GroES (HSP10)